jgi:hypothetical protein
VREGENYNYAIIRTNHRSGVGAAVGVVKGETAAAEWVRTYRSRLTQEEVAEGWGYYSQRTTDSVTIRPATTRNLKPGSGPKR